MKCFNRFVKVFDIFGSPVSFRHHGQETYTSACGGLFSIILIAGVVALFHSRILTFLQKQDIGYTVDKIYQQFNLQINFTQKNFNLAIGMYGLDLNDDKKYFDIKLQALSSITSQNGKFLKVDNIDLQKCQLDNFQEQNHHLYYSLKLNQWLCLPNNFSFELQGKFSDSIFKYLKLRVMNCSGESYCKSNQELQEYIKQNQSFQIKYYFTNHFFTPDTKENVVKQFFDDSLHLKFNPLVTLTLSDIFFMPFSITTDHSQFPFPNLEVEQGYFFDNQERNQQVPINQDKSHQEFLKLYFRKSNQKLKISRSFGSIVDQLSFLGGIFSMMILIGLVVVVPYNQFKSEISLANHILDIPQGEPVYDEQLPPSKDQKMSLKKQIDKYICEYHINSKMVTTNYFKYLRYKIIKFFNDTLNTQFAKNSLDYQYYQKINMIFQKMLEITVFLKNKLYQNKAFQLLLGEEHIQILKFISKQSLSHIYQTYGLKKQINYSQIIDKLREDQHLKMNHKVAVQYPTIQNFEEQIIIHQKLIDSYLSIVHNIKQPYNGKLITMLKMNKRLNKLFASEKKRLKASQFYKVDKSVLNKIFTGAVDDNFIQVQHIGKQHEQKGESSVEVMKLQDYLNK